MSISTNTKSRLRPRRGEPRILVSIIFLGFGSYCILGKHSQSHDYSSRASASSRVVYTNLKDVMANDFDAILVLGGGVPMSLNEPPIYVQQRCDDAAAIRGDLDTPILTLSAGTAHLPQLLSQEGLPVWESTSSAAYLKEKHNIESNVFLETTSYDTIGNAFFARTSHTDIVNWRKILVITNQFHMERTQVIFDWIFGIENKLSPNTAPYQLSYFASADVGLSQEALNARKEHEMRSTEMIRNKLVPTYTTMKDVWTFLNQSHDLYAAKKLIQRTSMLTENNARSDALKKSYGAK